VPVVFEPAGVSVESELPSRFACDDIPARDCTCKLKSRCVLANGRPRVYPTTLPREAVRPRTCINGMGIPRDPYRGDMLCMAIIGPVPTDPDAGRNGISSSVVGSSTDWWVLMIPATVDDLYRTLLLSLPSTGSRH